MMTTFTKMMRDDVASWTGKCPPQALKRDHTFVPRRKGETDFPFRVKKKKGLEMCG